MAQIDWDLFISKEAVVFVEEIPKKLHFTGIDQGTIEATKQGVLSPIPMVCLILNVDREDNAAVVKKWYCASKKAVYTLKPYIVDGSYTKREFTVTKHGKAPAAFYEIAVGAAK